jgi:hypothetical protein
VWALDGKLTNWKVEKNSRNVPFFSSVVQTIETDSNILDECAAKNEWIKDGKNDYCVRKIELRTNSMNEVRRCKFRPKPTSEVQVSGNRQK